MKLFWAILFAVVPIGAFSQHPLIESATFELAPNASLPNKATLAFSNDTTIALTSADWLVQQKLLASVQQVRWLSLGEHTAHLETPESGPARIICDTLRYGLVLADSACRASYYLAPEERLTNRKGKPRNVPEAQRVFTLDYYYPCQPAGTLTLHETGKIAQKTPVAVRMLALWWILQPENQPKFTSPKAAPRD